MEYESKEVEEEYYTEERSEEEETTCEEIPSLAIYLATLEKVLTWKEEEPTIEELKVDLDNLSEKERVEVVKLFEAKEKLFTKGLDELTQTDKRAKGEDGEEDKEKGNEGNS
ncbi:11197_t:CDS:2 [Acaulospora morrowiae]|uniref:11197_t:CDS:1 n=1 Tax=Acaulospora morrowiae TaxID=94023 RepID=A0A9N9FD24_9GLOM|nr:11197_t:CDS:2 [Acaulospora morrowiae]